MDRLEGLWTAEFTYFDGWTRGGIVVLEEGRFIGGGEQYYILGRYKAHSGVFEGDARCSHFHGPAVNLFGDTAPDFHLMFKGRLLTDLIEGELHRPEQPRMRLPFSLTRRAELA